jgi:lysozyme
MKWKAKLAIILSLFLIGYLGYLVLNTKGAPVNKLFFSFGSQIPQSYPLLGIDVSHYQGDINWNQVSDMNVQNDSIQFAYIKATEGATVFDDKAEYNIKNSRLNGIDAGFYHYFHPKTSAVKQADFFIDKAFNFNYSLKPAIDIEVDEGLPSDELIDSVLSFMNRIEDRIGERPIIYTYANFYDTHFKSSTKLNTELFWIAQYNVDCPLMKKDNVQAWQFSEKGTVSGINEKVDLNIAKMEFLEKVRVEN